MRTTVAKFALITLIGGAMAFGQASTAPTPPTPPTTTPATPAPPRAPRTPRTTRVVQSGSYLGVDTRDVTPDRVGPLKLPSASGVEITMVDQDAPAGKAGLKEHDVIVSFEGKKVENIEQLRKMIREATAGKSLPVGIIRDGQAQTVNVQLAKRREVRTYAFGPNSSRTIVIPDFQVPDIQIPDFKFDFDVPQITVMQSWARAGVSVQDLTPQLGEFFGVKNGDGVLVRSVEKGSAAETAGLRAGDVIVKVNGDSVSCSSDWRHAMREQHGGTVSVGIVRDKHEQTLSIKMPERKNPKSGSYHIEMPDFNPALEELRTELERMRPELERSTRMAQAQAMHEVERALRQAERELDQARREREREMTETQREHTRVQRELERQRQQAERERQRGLVDAQQEMMKQFHESPAPQSDETAPPVLRRGTPDQPPAQPTPPPQNPQTPQ